MGALPAPISLTGEGETVLVKIANKVRNVVEIVQSMQGGMEYHEALRALRKKYGYQPHTGTNFCTVSIGLNTAQFQSKVREGTITAWLRYVYPLYVEYIDRELGNRGRDDAVARHTETGRKLEVERVVLYPQESYVQLQARRSPAEVLHIDLDSSRYEDLHKAMARVELCLQLILEGKP